MAEAKPAASTPARKKVTIPSLVEKMKKGEPIVQLAVYDYETAIIADRVGIDILCVSDTGGMVLFGHETTTSVARSPLTSGFADPYAGTAERLAHLPIWMVHGATDPVVPVEESRQMAAALEAVGATVRYDELPDVGHDAWDRAYGDPELWRWLFAQRRAAR